MGGVDRVSQSPSASYMLSVKHTEVSMPKGPNGEKRPVDAIGLAVMIGKIATGEVDDVARDDGKSSVTNPEPASRSARSPSQHQLRQKRS